MPRQSKTQDPAQQDKPKLIISPKYYPWAIVYAYPIRLCIFIVIPLFFLHDLAAGIAFMTGMSDATASLTVLILVFLSCYGGPLIINAMEYQYCPYKFYDNHLEFRQSIFLKESIKIQYKAIEEAKVNSSWAQKKYKIGNICLAMRSHFHSTNQKAQGHELPDIPSPEKYADKINLLLSLYNERRRQAQEQA